MTEPLNVALLGFGTVGSAVAKILTERQDLADRIKLTHIFNRNVSRKRVDWVPGSVIWTENVDEVFASRPDVVVEVIGGLEPAGTWVRRALEQGACVATANKALLAAHGPELLRMAADHNAPILFEATVGGGVPIIRGIREGLAGDELTGVAGILNGTCNYVLSQMTKLQQPMDAVLADAQRLGLAENDPTADLDGLDAAAKVVILAGVAFHQFLRLTEVPRQSIRSIGAVDFRYASRLDCTIRQISVVQRQGDGLYASVGPALVPFASSFGRNHGASNLITTVGKYGQVTEFKGPGAGGPPTAVAVVSDLLALARSRRAIGEEKWSPGQLVAPPLEPYYLRFLVEDRSGIVAAIAAILARQKININAIYQDPGHDPQRLPFVITVEPCEESALRVAMAEIAQADFHREPPLVLPILL